MRRRVKYSVRQYRFTRYGRGRSVRKVKRGEIGCGTCPHKGCGQRCLS